LPSPSPTQIKPAASRRPLLHILTTRFLEGSDVLVTFSDGSSAIYEAEELEKLRPIPKRILPAGAAPGDKPAYADVA